MKDQIAELTLKEKKMKLFSPADEILCTHVNQVHCAGVTEILNEMLVITIQVQNALSVLFTSCVKNKLTND